jgi:hypothetical protein
MVVLRPVIAIATLSIACAVVPNPDYRGEAGETSGTTEATGDDSSSGAAPQGSSSDVDAESGAQDVGTSGEGDPWPSPDDTGPGSIPPVDPTACEVSAEPSGGACPEVCTACEAGICRIDCTGDQTCKEAEIACPPGWPCLVQCMGKQSCQASSVICSPEHACHLACAGEQGCIDLALYCGAGTCDLDCGLGKESCKNVDVRCGTNALHVVCAAPQDGLEAEPFPGSACACDVSDACD